MHYESKTSGHIEGLLYTGDQKNKYTYKNNVPIHGHWWRADPSEMYLFSGLKHNKQESSRVMLKLVDFDPEHRPVHPTAPTVEELTTYRISPERHNAY